jgi:SSS family solute:Na+ symporter
MRSLDWLVLITSLLFILVYGLWKGRGSKDIQGYLLAGRQMRWFPILLSIMATQASAITFLSLPGQAYVDGVRFVQFYLGLPIAMVILSITAVPLYHKLNIYTAYEFLENRFDLKTRSLAALFFINQRGF